MIIKRGNCEIIEIVQDDDIIKDEKKVRILNSLKKVVAKVDKQLEKLVDLPEQVKEKTEN